MASVMVGSAVGLQSLQPSAITATVTAVGGTQWSRKAATAAGGGSTTDSLTRAGGCCRSSTESSGEGDGVSHGVRHGWGMVVAIDCDHCYCDRRGGIQSAQPAATAVGGGSNAASVLGVDERCRSGSSGEVEVAAPTMIGGTLAVASVGRGRRNRLRLLRLT